MQYEKYVNCNINNLKCEGEGSKSVKLRNAIEVLLSV